MCFYEVSGRLLMTRYLGFVAWIFIVIIVIMAKLINVAEISRR